MKRFLQSLSSMGCARMLGVGLAGLLAVGSLGPSWRQVPVDIEDGSGAEASPAASEADARAAVEALLAQRSNLSTEQRRRVARAIVEESADAQLDPVFVLALMGVESELDRDAVSSRGAHGLMQLRDATALFLSEREQMGVPAASMGDPALNVRVGIRYLHRLHRAFGGDLSVALIAYNAGPHRVSAYLSGGHPIPERFSLYPRKVRQHYQRLLGQVADGSLRVEHPLTIRVARL